MYLTNEDVMSEIENTTFTKNQVTAKYLSGGGGGMHSSSKNIRLKNVQFMKTH